MTFYTASIIYSFVAIIIYGLFRFGVGDYLRYTKNSKTYIRKSKSGFANFWFYKKIHAEKRMGYVYTLNILLMVFTIAYFLFAVSFGWAEALQMPIAVLGAALCCVQIPSVIFLNIYLSLEHWGVKFVLLKKFSSRGFYSSLEMIAEALAVAGFTVYNFVLATR